jgi:membrane-associated phospholipid phosphatase
VVELLLVLALLKIYDVVREHGNVRESRALEHGRAILRFEADLHLDMEHAINHWTVRHEVVNWLAAGYYQSLHTVLTMVVLGWLYVRRPEVYRWARTALVLINLIGLTVFFLVPVAPPRLLPGYGFVDSAEVAGLVGPTDAVRADLYGAMPSLHLGWATWVAVVCFVAVRRRTVARLWLLYPVVTGVVVMATGHHYLLDVFAGMAVATIALSHPLLTRGRVVRHELALT